MGKILGVSDMIGGTEVVVGNVDTLGIWQLHAGYILPIIVITIVVGVVTIRQFWVILFKLNNDRKFGLGEILKIILVNIVSFALIATAVASMNKWSITIDAPQELSYQRLGEQIVHIKWRSRKPVITQVLWGYLPNQIDNISLGASGEEKVKEHEAVIVVDSGSEIYFKILINGVKYGNEGVEGAYQVKKLQPNEGIYELKLKESK